MIPNDPSARWAATTLRVALGAMYVAHALLKLMVFTLAGTAAYFADIGLPADFAYVVFAAELGGGAAIVLGLVAAWAYRWSGQVCSDGADTGKAHRSDIEKIAAANAIASRNRNVSHASPMTIGDPPLRGLH